MKKIEALKSTVSIVDGKMILSLPTAKIPVVWQIDLEQAQSSAFTIQENKKEKIFSLVLKSQNGEIEEIAPFDSKESAVNVLMETSNALQNAHGKIKTSSHFTRAIGSGEKSDKLGALLAMLLVIVLILIWTLSSSLPSRLGASNNSESGSTSSSYGDVNAKESTGVAVSADDFLSNR